MLKPPTATTASKKSRPRTSEFYFIKMDKRGIQRNEGVLLKPPHKNMPVRGVDSTSLQASPSNRHGPSEDKDREHLVPKSHRSSPASKRKNDGRQQKKKTRSKASNICCKILVGLIVVIVVTILIVFLRCFFSSQEDNKKSGVQDSESKESVDMNSICKTVKGWFGIRVQDDNAMIRHDTPKCSKIVGGKNAKKDAWPWQVLITKRSHNITETLKKQKFILGGGSIIHKAWILTAAHLLDGEKDPFPVNKVAIFVGVFNRRDGVEDDSVHAYGIGKYFRHPNFNRTTFNNDIALIRLGAELDLDMNEANGTDQELTFTISVQPVHLPCTEGYPVGIDYQITDEMSNKAKCEEEGNYLSSYNASVVVTGFGSTKQTDKMSSKIRAAKKLRQGNLRIENNETCTGGIETIKNLSKGLYETLLFTENMTCCSSGSDEFEVDACKGDSGGPVVRNVKYHTDVCGETDVSRWVQVGIVSFGFGCGRKGILGYYTNVAKYISWINVTTNGIFTDMND